MDLIKQALVHYAEMHTTPESSLLAKINRTTHAKVLRPRMLSGHLQGRILSMISAMIRPNRILEIGTYTGYSALCMAEGLAENGKIFTIDVNEELEDMIRANIVEAGMVDKIMLIIDDAATYIPTMNEMFDMVFIDADKENYSKYFDLVIDKVNLNGIIIADNVLWSGKVLDEKSDKDTQAITAFNQKIQEDKRIDNILLPIRDGIMLMRKISL